MVTEEEEEKEEEEEEEEEEGRMNALDKVLYDGGSQEVASSTKRMDGGRDSKIEKV